MRDVQRRTVLITGGSGKLGRWAVREFLAAGYQVLNVDRAQPTGELEDGERYRQIDLGDVGEVAGAMSGCWGVVHLGAIPNPYDHADEVVFRNNTGATFAVLQAASLLGVNRVVIASSVSAYGMAWALERFPPLYAPLDEAHPIIAKDPYALSKEVDERTAEMFHRKTGMSVAALRFHRVGEPGEISARVNRMRDHLDVDAYGMWGYVDARDAARACRLALETDVVGFEAFNITAADTLSDLPTEELLRMYCSDVEIREPIPGTASAWSYAKAERMLGYTPQHSWQDAR